MRANTLLLLAALTGCAAGTASLSVPAAAEEAAIRALEERERLGVLQRDIAALQSLWSEHLLVNTPANQISSDRQAVFDLMRQGLINYSMFERRIERIRIDGDLAVVMGAETLQPASAAPQGPAVIQRRFTHVWKKQGGKWGLVARHANSLPRS